MVTDMIALTEEQVQEIKRRLEEVKLKRGPFKVDKDEFAWSVMDSGTEHANAILKILEEAEDVVTHIRAGHYDQEVCTRENVMKTERFARARANA